MSWDPKRTHHRKDRERATQVIARAHGVCQINGPECVRVATEADHIVPLAEGGSADRMQAVCSACHRAKTADEAARAKQILINKTLRPASRHPGLKQ